MWTAEELTLTRGTSLLPAITAKNNSLRAEFEKFRTATESLSWCKVVWWDSGLCTYEDWLWVDAMYRSRALEFPGIGDAVVPCIDMANHASGNETAAIYETDALGNGILLLRPDKRLSTGEEVTITLVIFTCRSSVLKCTAMGMRRVPVRCSFRTASLKLE